MTDLQAPKPRPKRHPDSVEGVYEPSVFQVSVLDLTPGPLQERIKWRTFSIEIFARIIILNQSNQSQ